MTKPVAFKMKKRRFLARDLVTLSSAEWRISMAAQLLYEAGNVLSDDRLKMPELDVLKSSLHAAARQVGLVRRSFSGAFSDDKTVGMAPLFSREYLEMVRTSYKGGPGEVD